MLNFFLPIVVAILLKVALAAASVQLDHPMYWFTQLPTYDTAMHAFSDQLSRAGFAFPARLSNLLDGEVFPRNGFQFASAQVYSRTTHHCQYKVGSCFIDYKHFDDDRYSMEAYETDSAKAAFVIFGSNSLIQTGYNVGPTEQTMVVVDYTQNPDSSDSQDDHVMDAKDDDNSEYNGDDEMDAEDNVYERAMGIIKSLWQQPSGARKSLYDEARRYINQCSPQVQVELYSELTRAMAELEIHPDFTRFLVLGDRWTNFVKEFNRECCHSFGAKLSLGSLLSKFSVYGTWMENRPAFTEDGNDIIYTFETEGYTMMYILNRATETMKLRAFQNDTHSHVTMRISLNH